MKNIFLSALMIGSFLIPISLFAHEGHTHLTSQEALEHELKALPIKSKDELWAYLQNAQIDLGKTIAKREVTASKINVLKLKTALQVITQKKGQ